MSVYDRLLLVRAARRVCDMQACVGSVVKAVLLLWAGCRGPCSKVVAKQALLDAPKCSVDSRMAGMCPGAWKLND